MKRAAFASLFLTLGCLPSPEPHASFARMGESAPQFGDSPDRTTLGKFFPGTWARCNYMDPEFAKQMGLQSLSEQDKGQPISDIYEVSPDGTFTYYEKNMSWRVKGVWRDTGQSITLTYQTFDGKSLEDARAEIQKRAETGTQGAVRDDVLLDTVFADMGKLTSLQLASDKRKLVFEGQSADNGAVGNASGQALERLQLKK